MKTVILKIKTSLHETAEEALALYGEGGNPNAMQIEDFVGYVNTPPVNGYVRMLTTEAYCMALEYIAANGGSVNADLVRVEWEGQQPFVCGVDGEGNDILLGGIA